MGMKRSYSLTFFLHFLTIHKNPTQWLKNLLYSKKDDTKGNRYVFHTCIKKLLTCPAKHLHGKERLL